jgi:hypothetical protein
MDKGGERDNAGRPKGTPNNVTAQARELFTNLIQNNSSRIQSLFEQVAEGSPAKALELYLKMTDFVLPKLKSIEVKQDTNLVNKLEIQIIETSIALASSESEIVN